LYVLRPLYDGFTIIRVYTYTPKRTSYSHTHTAGQARKAQKSLQQQGAEGNKRREGGKVDIRLRTRCTTE